MKILRLIALVVLFALPAFAVRTFYIANAANGGADTNNGTAKATPWAHLPGMPTCTNTCAATTPTSDDSFIFMGGNTWTNADMDIAFWSFNGTSGHPVYIGVDKTWFAGGAWTRPIFTCGGASCAQVTTGAMLDIASSYVTVDNIEFTGLFITGSQRLTGVRVSRVGDEVKNCYFHGATHAVGASPSGPTAFLNADPSGGGTNAQGSSFHDNVIDNSDGDDDHWYGILHGDTAYNNIVRHVSQGIQGSFNDLHGNLIENIVADYTGDHCNMVLHYGPLTGSTVLVYNNVIRNSSACASSGPLWLNGLNGAGWAGVTVYAYNNVLYGNGNQAITIGGHPSSGGASTPNYGAFYIYNNSIDAGASACIGNGESAPRSTTHYANNFCIGGSLIDTTGTTGVNDGGSGTTSNIVSATLPANYDNASATYPFSPTNASASGISGGLNLTTFCAATGTGTACSNDTTFAVGYNTSTHAVVAPGRTVNARTVATPDIGSYSYSSAAAATAALTATPAVIKLGTPSTLASTCTNSSAASIDNGIGSVSATTANTSVSPTTATTYTLTCTPTAGSPAAAAATVTIGGFGINAGVKFEDTVMQ